MDDTNNNTAAKGHHVECCPLSGDNLCDRCLDRLEGGPEAEEKLAQALEQTACGVCGKTGYYKYRGPTYEA